MKKRLLFVCFFSLLLFQGKAQQYQPIFGDEMTQWLVTGKYTIPEYAWMDTISAITTDDEYKIMEYKSRWSHQCGIIGKIRTNETNSKLYLIEPDSTAELLIMDLDLSVGDTFDTKTEYNQFRTLYVEGVYILDGKKHIQFNEDTGGQTRKMFIEGVGPNWGFEPEYEYHLICKQNDFTQTYSLENEYFKDCDFVGGVYIDNPTIERNIKIYPNPASEYVIIDVSEISLENVYLTIYNVLGVEILNRMLFDSETVLDLSDFPNDVYFFKFQTSEGIITKKIVTK